MNVMVTGCAGFIGSHTCEELLRRGYTVCGIDSMDYAADPKKIENLMKLEGFHFYECYINDDDKVKTIVESKKITHILNFAAHTHVDNSIVNANPFIYSNISGVVSLLNVVRQTNVDFVHISTDEVYGPAHTRSFHESSPIKPKNPYAASKAAADLMIESFKNTYNVKARIIRPCNNFGPGQHKEKFIPTILRSLEINAKIPIYGDGKQTREWMFVKDTARIICDLLDKNVEFDVLNITSSNEMTNIDVVKMILDKTNKLIDDNISFVKDRPGHDIRYSISAEKMKSLLHTSFTPFESGIEETIRAWKEND